MAWRLSRHALVPASGTSVVSVVERVLAVRGWPDTLAESAVGVRLAEPNPGGLQRALDAGDLIRSYAFRGGSYVFSHEIAAVLLALRTATGIWRTDRWQRQAGFALEDWEPLREAVCAALAAGPLTRGEIAERLGRDPALRHLVQAAATGAGADTLYKPLHWWGDICFGPSRDGESRFRLLRGDPRWPGLPDVDAAGRRAVALYLRSYGPATTENLGYWLVEGLGVPRRRLAGWLTDLGDEITEVSVDGVAALALTADLDELAAAEPTDAITLLPGYDPWVLGPGTADARLVSKQRRSLVSSGRNLVVQGGRVCGTWQRQRGTAVVTWFPEIGPAPEAELVDAVERLAAAVEL